MDKRAILRKFEDELRETRKNYEEGKLITLEKFDWGISMRIEESKAEYRVANEAWLPIMVDPRLSW